MRNLQSYVDQEYQKNPAEAMRLYDGKTVEEAFPRVLKRQLKSRMEELKKGRAAMLRERGSFIANLQNGTYLVWKEGLDQLEEFIVLNLNWGTKLINEFATNGDPEEKHLFHALIKNHSRSCLMAEEILHLLKGGFPDAAFARWRSLYEVAVTASFIGLQGGTCAEAYLDHEIVDDLKCHQLDLEAAAANGVQPESEVSTGDLERVYREMLVKHGDSFKRPFGWAAAALELTNPQFKDLEESLGQDHMRVVYKRASHKIHAATNGIAASLGAPSLEPDAPMLRAPSHEGLELPAILCAHSLRQVSASISTLFNEAESLIEMSLFCELLELIEKTFERVAAERVHGGRVRG